MSRRAPAKRSPRSRRRAPDGVTVHDDGGRELTRIPGVRFYADGRVWVESLGRFHRTPLGRNHLSEGILGGQKSSHASRLILEAFAGPPPFPLAEARHLNDDPHDDRTENLAWGTRAQNFTDAAHNYLRSRWRGDCEENVRELRIRVHRGMRIPYRWRGVSRHRALRIVSDPFMFPDILTDPEELEREAARRQPFDEDEDELCA